MEGHTGRSDPPNGQNQREHAGPRRASMFLTERAGSGTPFLTGLAWALASLRCLSAALSTPQMNSTYSVDRQTRPPGKPSTFSCLIPRPEESSFPCRPTPPAHSTQPCAAGRAAVPYAGYRTQGTATTCMLLHSCLLQQARQVVLSQLPQ